MNDTHTTGPLTVDDLKQSRQVNQGAVWTHHSPVLTCPPCTGNCSQGRDCTQLQPAEACTEIGVESMLRYRRTTSMASWGIALVLVLVMAGYLLQTIYPVI